MVNTIKRHSTIDGKIERKHMDANDMKILTESLINRGINMSSINTALTQLFQIYSHMMDRITGNELVGSS